MRPLAIVALAGVALHPQRATAQASPVAPRADGPTAARHAGPMTPELRRDDAHESSLPDPTRVVLGAGAHASLGPGPGPAVGVVVSAELANLHGSVGLEGRYDLPASAPTGSGARARLSLAGAQLVPCLRAQGMWACAVVLVANLHASASRLPEGSVSDDFPFLGMGVRLALHLSLPADFALRIGGQMLAHPLPVTLAQGDTRFFRSSAVSATLGPTIVRVF